MRHILPLVLLLALVGCGDDKNNTSPKNDPPPQENNNTPDAGDPNNTGNPDTDEPATDDPDPNTDTPEPDTIDEPDVDDEPDTIDDPDADADADEPDMGDPVDKTCLKTSLTGDWDLEYSDSVSIAYESNISTAPDGSYPILALLFERYSPGPDIGTFELGQGADENFGNCSHCVFLRSLTNDRVYFASEGTLTTRLDPYSRKLDLTVTGLRLMEVEVDPFTRASTPIPDADCVEIEDFTATGNFPATGWTCPVEQYGDGELCHCTCGAYDPDCGDANSCLPGSPGCDPEPYVPLPIVDCEAEQLCTFDPETFATACTDTCDWESRTPCAEGTCIYDYGLGEGSTCIESPSRVIDANFGEPCLANNFQQFCNVVEGVALGYCGPHNLCRAVCTEDAECTADGETCRHFLGEDGLGYCGPEPTDG